MLPKHRLTIELEISNGIPGLSNVATRELEKLHELPEGFQPTINQWYKWYGIENLPDLIPHFMRTGGSTLARKYDYWNLLLNKTP